MTLKLLITMFLPQALNNINYRPVSILPVAAKVAESVVCQQLTSYLMPHFILSDAQHGIRPGRSTETAMFDAVGYLIRGLDGGQVSSLTDSCHI